MAFTPVDYIASYFGWNQFTPALPNFYWDVYSAEERVKKICFELDKLCNYANMLADNINIDHNLITELQNALAQIETLPEIDAKVVALQETADSIEAILENIPDYSEFLDMQEDISEISDSLATKIPWPIPPNSKYGTNGQVLRTNGDGSTQWQAPVIPTDSQAETYITQWLDEHPEATTTVQDGSITGIKVADETIMLSKLNPDVLGGAIYDINLTSDDSPLYEMDFNTSTVENPYSIEVKFTLTVHSKDTWSLLRVRPNFNNTTYVQKTAISIDNSVQLDTPIPITVSFDATELAALNKVNMIRIWFDRGNNQLIYDVTIENLQMSINDISVPYTIVPPSWLTIIRENLSPLATKAWCEDSFELKPEQKPALDMTRYVLPTMYTVCDDSSNPDYYPYSLYVDYMSTTKDVLFKDGSDHINIWPNMQQVTNVDTTSMTLEFKSNDYNPNTASIQKVSTKMSVPNAAAKVLCIGDSVTQGYGAEGEQYFKILYKLLRIDNIKFNRDSVIELLGSRGGSNYTFTYNGLQYSKWVCNEGRSGWSVSDYYSQRDFVDDGNPFYDGDKTGDMKFSIAKWLERFRTMDSSGNRLTIDSPNIGSEITASNINTINVCEPDYVVINLGHNDFYQAMVMSEFFTKYQEIITDIRTTLPSTYVVVAVTMPLVFCAHPELYGNYQIPAKYAPTDVNYYNRYLQNVEYWKNFISINTDDKIIVFPQWNIIPTVAAYEWEKCEDTTLIQSYVTKNEYGAAHPYAPAHRIIGYALYSQIKNTMIGRV